MLGSRVVPRFYSFLGPVGTLDVEACIVDGASIRANKNHFSCECARRVLPRKLCLIVESFSLARPTMALGMIVRGLTSTCVGCGLVFSLGVSLMWTMILGVPHDQRASSDHTGFTRGLRSFAAFIFCYPGTRCPRGSHPTVSYDPGPLTSEMNRKIIYTHPSATCTVLLLVWPYICPVPLITGG